MTIPNQEFAAKVARAWNKYFEMLEDPSHPETEDYFMSTIESFVKPLETLASEYPADATGADAVRGATLRVIKNQLKIGKLNPFLEEIIVAGSLNIAYFVGHPDAPLTDKQYKKTEYYEVGQELRGEGITYLKPLIQIILDTIR
ncbi:MAG: hypothetical protein ACFFDP_01500 [Promethearchaeota archaeon]